MLTNLTGGLYNLHREIKNEQKSRNKYLASHDCLNVDVLDASQAQIVVAAGEAFGFYIYLKKAVVKQLVGQPSMVFTANKSLTKQNTFCVLFGNETKANDESVVVDISVGAPFYIELPQLKLSRFPEEISLLRKKNKIKLFINRNLEFEEEIEDDLSPKLGSFILFGSSAISSKNSIRVAEIKYCGKLGAYPVTEFWNLRRETQDKRAYIELVSDAEAQRELEGSEYYLDGLLVNDGSNIIGI